MTDERASRGPSLLPREHGAYAQLGFPLATALAFGDLGSAPVLLVVGIIAGTAGLWLAPPIARYSVVHPAPSRTAS